MWHFASRGSVSQILINIGSWGPPVKLCWGQSLAIINVLACLNLNYGKKNRIESLEPVSAGDNLFIFHSNFKRLLVSNTCLSKYCLGVLLGISIVHYEREIHPELVYAELGQRERERGPFLILDQITKHFTINGTNSKKLSSELFLVYDQNRLQGKHFLDVLKNTQLWFHLMTYTRPVTLQIPAFLPWRSTGHWGFF